MNALLAPSRSGRSTSELSEREELLVLREVVAAMRRTAEAAERGDSEARLVPVPGAEALPDVVALRSAFNGTLDRTDAFVREVVGSLESIAEGRLYREVLAAGLNGAFVRGVEAINAARAALIAANERARSAEELRLRLADSFEETVLAVSEQVAAAATELSATAASLSQHTASAMSEADSASATVGALDSASKEIKDVVSLISSVAAQTKLLALNAQIEAARAGDAGRGFTVVASEVKSLADTTARSTDDISAQVRSMTDASGQSASAMSSVAATVREMAPMVNDLQVAVDGGQLAGAFETQSMSGLAQMAELLRAEVDTFLSVLRQG